MKSTTPWSTANVPPQFLKPAFLTGCVPFKTLDTEPRVSYTLYIPETCYNPDPSLRHSKDAAQLHPAYHLPKLPLVVTVHGTRRHAEQCRDSLIFLAETMHVAILAPLFPAGPNGLQSLNNYKLLRDDTLRADTAMIDILQEVKQFWLGLATEEVFMIGFSGGGQFVHRFMYLYPSRLTAVSIGAPGRVTELDYQHKWPAGIKDVAERFDGAVLDLDMIRKVPIQLVVGALDTETHGGEEFWEWLEAMKKREKDSNDHISTEDKEMKTTNRVETLKRIKKDWQRHSIQCQLDIVDDAGHERQKVIRAVEEFLRPHIERVKLKMEHVK